MRKTGLLFTILLTALTACQKVVDADNLLDTDERIYISSYISPQDTVLRVNVSRALAAIGTPLSVNDQEANDAKFLVPDAQVSISNAAGEMTSLSYSEENRAYLADISTLPILADQNYFLKVTVDGEEYNGSCKIPAKVSEITERINLRDTNFGGREVDINLSFQDIAGERNFYVLGGLVTTTVQFDEEAPQTFSYGLFFGTDEFLRDNLLDGGALSGNSLEFIGSDTEVLEAKITLQVANVEEALYQNLKTASTNRDADGNPFVEFAIAPNNIQGEGAVGVFAGYQITQKTIVLDL